MNLPIERVMSAHTRVRADARLALAELTFKTGVRNARLPVISMISSIR